MVLFRLTVALALAIVIAPFGCHPTVPNPVRAIPVRDIDLMAIYRDDPDKAKLAYDGQPIRLLCQNVVVIDSTTLGVPIWHDKPPVLILTFVGPIGEHKNSMWVTGTCHGRRDDGVDRTMPGFGFVVVVTDCAISDEQK